MDPGGSELDSSLPQPENPCLIVEDSQPDSVALEDDPESSYRALLARRLSSLQPTARSPVLELISSPVGSRCSQTDQSVSSPNNNSQSEPDILMSANQSSGFHEERQVLNKAPPPNSKRCSAEADMDSGADSTTHGVHTEEGTSQMGLLELSQSQNQDQDLRGEQDQPAAEQNIRSRSSQSQDHRTFRSEVSSSSSEPGSGRRLTVQDLLHSQNQDQQDSDILSSQEDLFVAEKTGAGVDSTVSEPQQRGQPTPGPTPSPTHTPAHTLHLLHLSGQGTLVQQSLSQSSVDFVAPTPENFSNTPLIVPSSPTGAPDGHVSAAEPMDTSLLSDEKDDEPMETGACSKPLPSASTPLSQNSPGFVLERPLSVPSQPDLSHDVFVATQSSEVPQTSENKNSPVPPESSLSVSCSLVLQTGDDSQATQIQDDEEGVGPLGVDTTDSAPANCHKTSSSNGISKEAQSASPTKCLLQPDVNSKTVNIADRAELNSCVMEMPSDSASSLSVISQTTTRTTLNVRRQNSLKKNKNSLNVEEEGELSEGEELESTMAATSGGGASGLALALSQSQVGESVVMVTDSDRDSQKEANNSQPIRGKVSASTNGHHTKEGNKAFYRLSQTERAGPDTEGTKDKSLDSSGEISFHFTLPKEGELIGPAMSATPPLISQLKQTLRHSTPIEINSFSEKPDVAAGVSNASDIVPGESSEDSAERADGKLSLRMKLVTPVEEGSSERFSLQKPTLAEEDSSVVTVTTVAKAVTSPSVFSRVRQVHRQQEDGTTAKNHTPVRAALFASPPGCNSLPNSQSEPSQQGVGSASQGTHRDPAPSLGQTKDRQGPQSSEPKTQSRTEPGQKVFHQACDGSAPSPSKRPVSHQPPVDMQRSPSFRRTTGPSHRRHVRTIQEVRTTVTRIITDVFYEDGREVERKVTEESEEPVVDCQVLDSDVSPCQTGSSSLASGDLADISSLSSKACSLQHSSGGMSGSSSGGHLAAADFILPPSRPKASSPRRGGGQPRRGHRGQRAGLMVAKGRGQGSAGSRAPVPLSPRGGGARRGRPPSRPSSLSRGGGVGVVPRVGGHLHSSSEDGRFSSALLPRLPVSPAHGGSAHSDSLRSLPEEASSAGSSFVGLRVVAKWSSNGYFYSGRIIKDAGEGRFRLRFDDGYECEVAGKDILLCDPIPLETEVTALLEDEYFSTGVVKGHKTEGQDLFYHVERGEQRQWYNRTSVILSLDQGNRLREQHSLGPYEPATPLAKASDISLDNLVEGKRRRRGAPDTPTRTSSSSSTSSPRTPGPSGKRRLMSPEADRTGRTPPKRGRRGGNRSAQRLGVCNTSGSGTDGAGPSHDPADTHGPLPPNASLFMGFAFMLTASSESDRLTNRLSVDSDEGEDDYVQTGPYNKTYTEAQLQAGGGFVLPDFNEEQCKAAYQSLLIADQHCRTRKYLLCVASGVPCVSHMWVRDCCKENKLLNYRNYLLPAGAGPDGTIVEWHPRSSPFKALKVLLVFQKPPELWAQLIALGGGATVRQLHPDKDGSDLPSGKFDVVVTDATCPPSLEVAVTSQEVPLVSPEWLIQSLICGERLGFHSRPQYRHNFSL